MLIRREETAEDYNHAHSDNGHGPAGSESTNNLAMGSMDGDATGSGSAVGRAVYEVLRVGKNGQTRRLYVRRRDLLRANGLQPRDLRRIDPSMTNAKAVQGQTLWVKDEVLLINMGGVRLIASAERALLFEPNSPAARKFVDIVVPKLASAVGERLRENQQLEQDYNLPWEGSTDRSALNRASRPPPFELEMIEGALMVATGRLDAELVSVTRRVQTVLQKLPTEITPKNLEELRRVKSALVELDAKSDSLRELLEEMLDDEDELREFNLTSRPRREERKRLREREKIERDLERERRREEERQDDLQDAADALAARRDRVNVSRSFHQTPLRMRIVLLFCAVSY